MFIGNSAYNATNCNYKMVMQVLVLDMYVGKTCFINKNSITAIVCQIKNKQTNVTRNTL